MCGQLLNYIKVHRQVTSLLTMCSPIFEASLFGVGRGPKFLIRLPNIIIFNESLFWNS
jgi:hypothetical protein